MSASFQEHLELALGDEYRVVRELGGGGMSRVFLATEVALGRTVVIKVLTPELAAGVNRERFRREVQLAAGLQHPMIVPLLTAGEAEGLLWYTMPFVEGESLRERIQRGVMSQRDALPILIDVARALGAAHRKGIVHRDIKPGNILLHENHAVVADFGVAKALTASVSDSTGLTTSGLAVGTPAYMSPEQAAGDATVDGRADIYALGCVAYELLSGKPPFTDPSMARLLVAQVSQVPVPLAQVAPVRSGMAAAIMRCLAKDPAERWPTADALADALEQQRFTAEMPLPVPPPTSPVATERAGDGSATLPPRRRGLVGGGLAVALVIGVAVALSSGRGGPKTAVAFDAPQTVIVADVDNRTADSTLGDLVSEALRTELRESKLVTVMTPSATAEALQRMQRPNVQRIPAVLAREIAVREGVPLVVEGRIQKVGNTYLVRAALVSSADGAEQTAVQETATSEDGLIAAIGRLARRTREKLGESRTALTALAPMERVTTTSLAALRKYTEAMRIGDAPREERSREREIALLQEAVALDSTFAMAWRRLGVRLMQPGGGSFVAARQKQGQAALTRAFALRARLSPVERGLAEAAYYSDVAADPRRATAAYEAILAEQPTNRIALNNLANAALQAGQFDRLRDYGARYVAIDSSNLQAWPWVLYGAYGTGRLAEAREARARMRRRFTTPEQVALLDQQDLNWLALERDWPELERLARTLLAAARDRRDEDDALRSLLYSFLMRGQFDAAWKANDAVGARRLASADTADARIWRGDAARQRYFDRAWYLGDTVGIAAAIETYRSVSQVDAWPMGERPGGNLVPDFVLAGNFAVARQRLVALRAAAPRQADAGRRVPPPSSPSYDALEAQILSAEGRGTEALRALTPALVEARRYPSSDAAFAVGTAWRIAGEPDSARVWLSRLIDRRDPRAIWNEALFRHPALRILCNIAVTAEQKTAACGALVDEWKGADAIAQPVVALAKAKLDAP